MRHQLKYGLRGMVYLEFIGTRWDSCDKYPHLSEICVGKKGYQVLEGLHNEFEVINNVDRFSEDLGVLILLALLFKAAYVYFLVTKSRAATRVLPALESK